MSVKNTIISVLQGAVIIGVAFGLIWFVGKFEKAENEGFYQQGYDAGFSYI